MKDAVMAWLEFAWLFIQWRAARLWRWIRRKPEPHVDVPVADLVYMMTAATVAITLLKSPAIAKTIEEAGDGFAQVMRTILDATEEKKS